MLSVIRILKINGSIDVYGPFSTLEAAELFISVGEVVDGAQYDFFVKPMICEEEYTDPQRFHNRMVERFLDLTMSISTGRDLSILKSLAKIRLPLGVITWLRGEIFERRGTWLAG